MAFAIRSLTRTATVPVASGRNFNSYAYATDDAVATVIAAGYFNAARSTLKVNDQIDSVCVHNGTGDRVSVLVTAVPADPGNITVAVNTDASGA